MFTRRSVLYMCGAGYMFNQVLYVHQKKCVVYMCVYVCLCVGGCYHV